MDKLRKIGERLWYNKERVVLVAMVIVLCWNVYKVAFPPKPEEEKAHPVPSAEVSGQISGEIPLEPQPKPLTDWKPVYEPHPFWSLSGATVSGGGSGEDKDPGVTLVDIKKVGSKYRAKLKTASSNKWYDENEKAEDFELLSIDPDARTVKVRSERLGRTVELSIQ